MLLPFQSSPVPPACAAFPAATSKYASHSIKVRSVVHLPCYTAITPRDCWVSVKQFSRIDTATACQDWLRSTRLGRGSIKSHVRTVKVLGMGLFAYQGSVHLWQGVTHLTLYQSRVPRVLRPLESLLTSPVGDVDSPHRKLSQKAHPAVCGEEKALLRKCNNPL